jgi:hypothetical protein
MAKTTVVSWDTPAIEEGRRFLELLSEAGIRVQAALWQWSELSEEWQFLIVTPSVEELGLKGTYRRLDDILSTAEKAKNRPAVDLLNVSLMTPEARFYKSLRRELRNVHDRQVSKRPVGDHVIEKGFIYFVR